MLFPIGKVLISIALKPKGLTNQSPHPMVVSLSSRVTLLLVPVLC